MTGEQIDTNPSTAEAFDSQSKSPFSIRINPVGIRGGNIAFTGCDVYGAEKDKRIKAHFDIQSNMKRTIQELQGQLGCGTYNACVDCPAGPLDATSWLRG